ncbi:hypothetical protein SDC9_92574 [bioreactor metagenome]|uniref:Uncharacterized protein n=1 Tax=bioreactor metagenome TaxID=1076179 RepID=A0A644ZYI1_9ZZZZ
MPPSLQPADIGDIPRVGLVVPASVPHGVDVVRAGQYGICAKLQHNVAKEIRAGDDHARVVFTIFADEPTILHAPVPAADVKFLREHLRRHGLLPEYGAFVGQELFVQQSHGDSPCIMSLHLNRFWVYSGICELQGIRWV